MFQTTLYWKEHYAYAQENYINAAFSSYNIIIVAISGGFKRTVVGISHRFRVYIPYLSRPSVKLLNV